MSTIKTRFSIVLLASVLAGCASTAPRNPHDPLENFNRAMFSFNDAADEKVLKPAAEIYKRTLPTFVQIGIGNFFSNLGDIWTGANNLLQGKGADGASDLMRFAINSSFGLGGLIDIASSAGLPRHKEDFGQTLGRWGVVSGPYLVLPLLGPSTVRDALVLPIEWTGDPWLYKEPVLWRNVGTAVRVIDQRAAALDASTLIEEAALDRYEFVRDAYLQRRQNTIDDGDTAKSISFDDDGQILNTRAPIAAEESVETAPNVADSAKTEPSSTEVVKNSMAVAQENPAEQNPPN